MNLRQTVLTLGILGAFLATTNLGVVETRAQNLSIRPLADEIHLQTTFNVKEAGTGAGQGTQAASINIQGKIAGFYFDSNNVPHGFVRTERGDITTFDAPGAVATLAFGNNPEGAIAGFYFDSNGASHGFVRAPFGAIHTFDAPGAIATFAAQINPAGVIAGDYADASNVSHAYLRAPDGDITSFDAPGAGTGPGQGTMTGFIDCINPEGAMTGYLIDASNVFHGYVRAPDGNITTFDAPGAGTGAGQGTFPAGINLFGMIEGNYVDAGNVFHGFVRAPFGAIHTFDAPSAGSGAGQGTFPATLNDFGMITGSYLDASGVYHGFVRSRDGKFATFDAPGADRTPGDFNGTFPSDINPFGVITGYYTDEGKVSHGFVAVPCDQCSENDDDAAIATSQVNPAFPVMLNPKLRLVPWYQFGAR
jgi:hypothetical protein